MMSNLVLLAIGAYLATAMVVAAWRRASGSAEAVGAWVALSGLWAIVAFPPWTGAATPDLVAAGLGWAAACLILTLAGHALGGRPGHDKVAWLLGPVQALGLAGIWMTAARRRARARREGAKEPGPISEDFESVVELGETTVGEIMVPRSDVAAMAEGECVRDWIELLREHRHHHILLYREDLDEVAGRLSVESLYARPALETPLARLVEEVRFVPESMRCDDLLREMIAAGEQVAVVVDEFGGTAGLVTDQDLFEILIGEIALEDPDRPRVTSVGDGVYLADGHAPVDDLKEWLSAPLPDGDYETLAGLVLDQLGRIPVVGDRVDVGPVRLEVLEATERRVLRLQLSIRGAGPGAVGQEAGAGGDRRR